MVTLAKQEKGIRMWCEGMAYWGVHILAPLGVVYVWMSMYQYTLTSILGDSSLGQHCLAASQTECHGTPPADLCPRSGSNEQCGT